MDGLIPAVRAALAPARPTVAVRPVRPFRHRQSTPDRCRAPDAVPRKRIRCKAAPSRHRRRTLPARRRPTSRPDSDDGIRPARTGVDTPHDFDRTSRKRRAGEASAADFRERRMTGVQPLAPLRAVRRNDTVQRRIDQYIGHAIDRLICQIGRNLKHHGRYWFCPRRNSNNGSRMCRIYSRSCVRFSPQAWSQQRLTVK